MTNNIAGALRPAPPFDFAQSLGFLGMFAPTRGEQALGPATLTKAVFIAGQPVAFEVRDTGSVAEPQMAYRLFAGQPLSEEAARLAVDRLAFFLSLNDDLRPFYAIGQNDPAFAPVIDQLYGYHQVKFLTPFENACWAVLTQRNQMPAARKMKQALIDRFGGTVEVDGVRYEAFPDAARMAEGADEIAGLIRHEQKAGYLRALAEAFSQVDEQWLRNGPYDEVEAWLRGIKGIGAWSASFVLLRGLGRMERVPLGEEALARNVARRYNNGQPLDQRAIERLAAPYGAWQGYWAHYLRVAGE